MLVQLATVQVQDNWTLVKYAIEHSLPPHYKQTPEFYTACFDALLKGQMHCWVAMRGATLLAVCVTQLVEETLNDQRNLLLFSVTGIEQIPPEMWRVGYDTLSAFARSLKCSSIIAYTDSPYIVGIIKDLGGTVRSFVKLEV